VASQAPILLTDIAFEMDSALNSMSRYVGYARAQRDFNKLYNVRMPGMVGSVKKAVSTKFGTGARLMGVTGEQYIENYIGDITGSRQAQKSFLTPIRRNLVRSTMTLNLRVGFSQLSAIPKAAAEVGWGNMARGFMDGGMKAIFSKQAREELARENVWFWQRWRGEGGQREFADAKGGGNIIDVLALAGVDSARAVCAVRDEYRERDPEMVRLAFADILVPQQGPLANAVDVAERMVEAGVDGVEASAWNAMIAPAGTPPDVLAQMSARLGEALRDAVRDARPDRDDLLFHVLVPAAEWWADIGYT
jgi:hypothetical protein